MIAANDNHTAVFSNCREALLGAKVEAGKFGGKTSKELIEALQYRFIDSGTASKCHVEHSRGGRAPTRVPANPVRGQIHKS